MLSGLWSRIDSKPNLELSADPACDLQQGPCGTRLPGGASVILAIEPRPVKAMKPLTFSLTTTGIDVRSATLRIAGVNMDMGIIHYELLRGESGSLFTAQGILPVCSSSIMIWNLRATISTGQQALAVSYPLETSAR